MVFAFPMRAQLNHNVGISSFSGPYHSVLSHCAAGLHSEPIPPIYSFHLVPVVYFSDAEKMAAIAAQPVEIFSTAC